MSDRLAKAVQEVADELDEEISTAVRSNKEDRSMMISVPKLIEWRDSLRSTDTGQEREVSD